MSTIALSNKAAKLMKLSEIEGFNSLDDLLQPVHCEHRLDPRSLPARYSGASRYVSEWYASRTSGDGTQRGHCRVRGGAWNSDVHVHTQGRV
jgi:hypothetical protein